MTSAVTAAVMTGWLLLVVGAAIAVLHLVAWLLWLHEERAWRRRHPDLSAGHRGPRYSNRQRWRRQQR